MQIDEMTEKQLIDYLKRPTAMNKKRAKELIHELQEQIIVIREKARDESRMQKNMYYNQIENRLAIIKHANTYL